MAFAKKGLYEEESSIWSEIKVVYMRLQGNSKCAYCERKLESSELGKIEQDVEHFRPKSNIRPWTLPKSLKDENIKTTPAPKQGRGYFLLPYHPFNYSAACKPCNSALKRDYFPIAGKYDLMGSDPSDLTDEEPFLICPIGDFDKAPDEAPEKLIEFRGVSPKPVASKGYRRERALVTIEFFKLDDQAKRKNLMRERAMIIVAMHPYLEKLADGATGSAKKTAQALIDGFTSSKSAHTNCAQCFRELFKANRTEANAIFEAAVALVSSIS